MDKCCSDKANRILLECNESVVNSSKGQYRAITKKEQCSVCGKSHYHMDAEPLSLQMEVDG